MLYIGVDLGTSAVKLLLMDENGSIHKIVSREYPLYFPHSGWSEQNPEDWFVQSMEGIRELTAECDKSQVRGISFGGQMHGLVVLDEADHVLRPAILWNDGRTEEETDYLNQVIGKETLSKYTANIAFAGFTAPKILWMKNHEPELYEKIAKIMLPKDYLAYKLSGTFCTEYSDASGMLLLDVQNKCWSKEMLDICGIREEQLPKLYESYEVVGNLKPEIAEELGLGFYDKNILRMNSDESGIKESYFHLADEKAGNRLLYRIISSMTPEMRGPSFGSDLISADNLFRFQSEVIRKLAEEQSCVIVGRCADYVLEDADNIELVRIFIYSDMDARIRRVKEKELYAPEDIKKNVKRIDKERRNYYRYYTGRGWADPENYDLLINTSTAGIKGSVRMIEEYIKIRGYKI